MKRVTFCFVLWLFIAAHANAQFMGKSRGFGGLELKLTEVNDETAVLFGGRIGTILNDTFVVGAGFYQLVGEVKPPPIPNERLELVKEAPGLDLDYVGLNLEYIFAPQRPFHLAVGGLFGGGRARYRLGDNTVLEEEGIWVIEPGANLFFRFAPYLRAGLGASYRSIFGVNRLSGLDESHLNGLSTAFQLQFGMF